MPIQIGGSINLDNASHACAAEDVYMEKCFAHTRGGCIFAISMVVASGNLDLKDRRVAHCRRETLQ